MQLKKDKEESLERFHPWIFSGAISRVDDGIKEGEFVEVVTFNREFIAIGHYQIGSIVVRILSFRGIAIDRGFWESRLKAVLNIRIAIGITDNSISNIYRLACDEGDLLPGLIIDYYGKTVVMQAHNTDTYAERLSIYKAFRGVMDSCIEYVSYKGETTLPFRAELGQQDESLYSGSDDSAAIENGLKPHVDWSKGQRTRSLVDQCENCILLEKYAKDRSVLNMFCHTGGPSMYATRDGAELVHPVDSSTRAVELANANTKPNLLSDVGHAAFYDDVFKYLGIHDVQHDLVVLDPPTFTKHRVALRNALKGCTQLDVKGFERVKSGGTLSTLSCSQVVAKENFRNAVFTAAVQAKCRVHILYQLRQSTDHSINIYHLKGEYLEGLVLYVE